LVDLDGDGRTDILSGSWPGEIYFFRRNADGTFAAGQTLKDGLGKPINVGSGSSAFAVDWNGDGTIDLLVGNVLGEVYFIPNEGTGTEPVFGKPRRVEAAGQPLKVNGDAAPVAADWDGDGRLDLIVGAEDGSVVWYRNTGSATEPRLEAARTLIPKSPLGWGSDDRRRPGDWGLRVKPCVVDWDGDGRLAILLGDRCGSFQGKPSQTAEEKTEERKANDQLPGLRQRWAALFREYRELQQASGSETPAAGEERTRRLDGLREAIRRTKDEITVVQQIQERYKPEYQTHGFVWLFRRKPSASGTPSATKGP
jgi:hypothetical protein